jgi:Ca-activated chloride channel family protein
MTPALAKLATPDPRGLGGLVALVQGAERPLPLRDVKVRASIVGDCARVEIVQRYANPYDTALEAVHMLPLPPAGAVTEMELHAGDIVVSADCRERKEAETTFAEARQAGHRAALLTAEAADIHTLRVTNLPPKAEVRVRIVLVERLEIADGRARWRFPTTIAPRYLPGNPVGHAGPGVLPDTDEAPDASRLSPPILLGGGAKLDLEVDVRGQVRTVESSLHVAKVSMDDGGVRVAPKGGATVDRDFVLTWTTASADKMETRAYTDGAYTLVVVEPPGSVLPQALPRDAVFVIDISGSMEGTKMDAAKRALTGALHGLMPGDRFAIIAFDDRLERFRPGFVAYDDQSLAAADTWVARLRARGGTEMLPAIKDALDGETPAGRVRTVLFITDGQAHNEQPLVAAVANRRGSARFFTLGIDTAVNEALMTRLARVGGGTCELCTPSDDIEEVVARIEARFGSPLADAVKVDGGELAGPVERTLFAGRPVTVLLKGAPAQVNVTGRTSAGTYAAKATPVRAEAALGALWARERVAELEDRLTLRPFEEEALRGEILRVALEHHIASRFTAFVAVERSTKVDGPRVEVVQPNMLPHGWDEGFAGGGAPRGGAPLGAPPPGAVFASAAPPAPMMDAMMMDPMSAPPSPRAAAPRMRKEAAAPAKSASPLRRAASALRDMLGGATPPPPPAAAPGSAPPPMAPAFDAMPAEAEELADAEPAPAMEQAKRAQVAEPLAPAPAAPQADPGATLARMQSADGSFGGDVHRTASALLALVLLGNTRLVGLRKRAVLKAATWLGKHSTDPHASVALAALARVERGDDAGRKAELRMLAEETPEGKILASILPG